MNFQTLATIAGAIVVILVQVLTFVFNQGKMASRHEENQRRFHRIEQALGIETGTAIFIRRDQADILIAHAQDKHDEVDRRLDAHDRKFDDLEGRVGVLEAKG